MNYELWDRDSLYEEVWITPMAKLAKTHGISDVGLAKVCRKLLIPLPGRGYWAKRDAGHPVQKLPLPPLNEPIRLFKPAPKREEPKIEDYITAEEQSRIAQTSEIDAEFVLKRGSLSHPLIVQTREVLGRSNHNAHDLLSTNEPCLGLSVSRGVLPRALRLAAALITALEKEGFKISVKNGWKEKTVASLHNQEIGFTIVEAIDRIPLASPTKGSVLQRVLTYAGTPHERRPSGHLGLRVWKPWNAKSWKDSKRRTLEDLLPEIVATFLRIALMGKAEAERRVAEAAAQQRAAEERARQAELIRQEENRVKALHRAAANLGRAERIRHLVAAAQKAASAEGHPTEPGTDFGDWLAWALNEADRIDPLKESPASILDTKPAPQPQYWPYGQSRPAPPFRWPRPLWRKVE